VNVFDTWVDKNATPLLSALNLAPGEVDIRFKAQYPTGLPGNPPNLDVVLSRPSGHVIAIESKFTEWLTPKTHKRPPLKDKYFPQGVGVWERVGLTRTQQLAAALQAGDLVFRHLDAPQLIKHSLGLATHLGRDFTLLYAFYDADGAAGEAHRSEISLFADQVGSEFGFQAIAYQQAFRKLVARQDAPDEYIGYLEARYFSGDAEQAGSIPSYSQVGRNKHAQTCNIFIEGCGGRAFPAIPLCAGNVALIAVRRKTPRYCALPPSPKHKQPFGVIT
jgi:hypothetical protein